MKSIKESFDGSLNRRTSIGFLSPESVIDSIPILNGSNVIDIGCGAGHYIQPLSRRARQVVAFDVNKSLLARVAQETKIADNVKCISGNIEQRESTKLKNNSMHAAMISNVLFQLEDKNAALQEIKRILAPSGRAIVFDWKDSFSGIGPHQSYVISESRARQLFEENGFHIESDLNHVSGAYHYGFLALKQ